MDQIKGRFGIHGGQYIPETLMNAVIELEKAYDHYKNDPEFQKELSELFNNYTGRPSLLYYAEKMTKDLGGAKIYLKRGKSVNSLRCRFRHINTRTGGKNGANCRRCNCRISYC